MLRRNSEHFRFNKNLSQRRSDAEEQSSRATEQRRSLPNTIHITSTRHLRFACEARDRKTSYTESQFHLIRLSSNQRPTASSCPPRELLPAHKHPSHSCCLHCASAPQRLSAKFSFILHLAHLREILIHLCASAPLREILIRLCVKFLAST